MAGKSIFTPPRFFLLAVTQLPYKEIRGEGGSKISEFFSKSVQNDEICTEKLSEIGVENFLSFQQSGSNFHLKMLSVNGLQNSISQPILHPKRGSCLLLASWIPLGYTWTVKLPWTQQDNDARDSTRWHLTRRSCTILNIWCDYKVSRNVRTIFSRKSRSRTKVRD